MLGRSQFRYLQGEGIPDPGRRRHGGQPWEGLLPTRAILVLMKPFLGSLSCLTRGLRPVAAALGLGAIVAAPCRGETAEDKPIVPVVEVLRGSLSRQISFDAELKPYQEVELRAKVTGFLENMKADVGDAFKEGQVIATLDVPELKLEIQHAEAAQRRGQAEIDRAKAAAEEAHLNFSRLSAADKQQPHLIAAADLDAATAKDRSAQAALDAAKQEALVAEAEVKRLQTMQEYTQITAPFAGVITRRYADTGALIQAGTGGGAAPVVRFSQNDRLRAVFPVSLSFVTRIKVGDPVEIRIESMQRTIKGTVARFTRKVETATRTMDAEVDVPNPDLSLIPGIYAVATLREDQRKDALIVPIEAVLRDKGGASVYVINQEHKIEERPVQLGLETPSKIEVVKGLRAGEMILDGSRALVKPGETVEVRKVDLTDASAQDPRTAKAN